MGCTLLLKNVSYATLASEMVKYLESLVGEGSVYACDIATERLGWKSRGLGRVQFENAEAADNVVKISQKGELMLEGSHLVASFAEHEMLRRPSFCLPAISLYAGSLVDNHTLAVLWSASNVAAEFSLGEGRIVFYVSENEVDYKMVLGFGDISSSVVFSSPYSGNCDILLKLQNAPKLFEKSASQDRYSVYLKNRYRFCKEDIETQWLRTTDFTEGCALGQSSVFCLELSIPMELDKLIEKLPLVEEMQGELLKDKDVVESVPSLQLVPYLKIPDDISLPYNIVFQLASLVHHKILSPPTLTHEFFKIIMNSKNTPMHIEMALSEMRKLKKTCFKPESWLRQRLAVLKSMNPKHIKPSAISPDKELMKFYRVLVTPCKIYFLGPELNLSNRVTRHFSKYSDDFLRISFVDEDLGRLHPNALSYRTKDGTSNVSKRTKIYQRILSILKEGIVIGGKKFEFLAFSASQLRENSFWMFASNDDVTAQNIRRWMGDFDEIRNVAKYAARMGQSFSSSWETSDVKKMEVREINDIEVTTDGIRYCFSDGIGKISFSLAKKIASKCGLGSPPPSAFQIRYAGYKGVVAIDPTTYHGLSLRPSMLKFHSNHKTLDVLNWSRSLPCYLNREIIILLSTLGIPDEAFEELQENALMYLDKLLTDSEVALEILQLMSSGNDNKILIEMLANGYCPNSEPFLLMMLKTFQNFHLMEHRTKCRIFVPKGRVLMGCLDESAKLNYGQVFIQVSKIKTKSVYDGLTVDGELDSSRTHILEGKVIVAKNPCLHPGDIRVLEAVNVTGLKHMVDCVVFPQKGHRPHPNECSGSDLDGDSYFICWDKTLIPHKQDDPMEYVSRPPIRLDHSVKLEEIQEYFVNYMLNDTLGLIANAHVVHADREPLKAQSPKCLELAALHSKAVDFAKTGIPAEMPHHLFPGSYPDFMEKEDGNAEESPGILGKLYRAVKRKMTEKRFSTPTEEEFCKAYDEDLEYEGFNHFIEEALVHKKWYENKLVDLMEYYGIENEAEIISGNVTASSKLFVREKKKPSEFKDKILMSLKALRSEARSWFEDSCSIHHKDFALSSAWYHATYHPAYWSKCQLVSFPWVLYDLLLRIKKFNEMKRSSMV